MLLEALQIPGDGFLNVGLSLGPSSSLRDTTRKRRAMDYKNSIFILLNDNSEFHGRSP